MEYFMFLYLNLKLNNFVFSVVVFMDSAYDKSVNIEHKTPIKCEKWFYGTIYLKKNEGS